MAVPIAVIIRFKGAPDDLLERFERARRLWIEAQGGSYERPEAEVLEVWRTGVAEVRDLLEHGWRTDA